MPKPFPQNAQYKKNFGPKDDEAEAKVPAAKKTKAVKKKAKRVPAQRSAVAQNMVVAETETYSANRYSELRKNFLDDLVKQGSKYKTACAEWDRSNLKRQLLGSLSLAELERRRFVEKTCDANPWS